MKVLKKELFKKAAGLVVIAVFISTLFISCSTSRMLKDDNPPEKNCGSFESIAYDTKDDVPGKLRVHGIVKMCKTNKIITDAIINFKDEEGDLIATTRTDRKGKFDIVFDDKREVYFVEAYGFQGRLVVSPPQIGIFHSNTELNLRLAEVHTMVDVIPLTKDDIRKIKKMNNRK